MSATLAVPAVPAEYQTDLPNPHGLEVMPKKDKVRLAAARLYGQGLKRAVIARILLNYLTPNSRHVKTGDVEKRVIVAKAKLRRWEQNQAFRDLVWQHAVVQTDLATPRIMQGMVRKAERGNVLAARLALEVTGRHNPKGDVAPTQVAVVFNGLPRPGRVDNGQQIVVAQAVEASEEAE